MLPYRSNRYRAVLPEPAGLPPEPELFRAALEEALPRWRAEGYRAVMLEIPIEKAALIPVATAAGFTFHHSGERHLMLLYRLVETGVEVPFATHFVGAGGVVVNERRELLVIVEHSHREERPDFYKLPGGFIHEGEHLAAGVVREVREETGVETSFESLVCIRNWHVGRFGKSDLYFVCRLRPLTTAISVQEEEIHECRWMPLEEYFARDGVSVFNKRIVELALGRGHLVSGWFEGYDADRAGREIFFAGPDEGSA